MKSWRSQEEAAEVGTSGQPVDHKTNLDDILKESGVGKGNFYYHFESKEALGYAILDRYIQRFSEHVIAKAFRPDRDPIERIFTLLDLFLEAQRARNCMGGCPAGNLAAEMSDIHEGFRQRLGEDDDA
ncbi:MAG: TetR/AcrR family transcriptional regulator [candidate division NC10 bacterium]|nr:TetR/AcrR family transcriptional regulator [candidate division NC10 bacterium]